MSAEILTELEAERDVLRARLGAQTVNLQRCQEILAGVVAERDAIRSRVIDEIEAMEEQAKVDDAYGGEGNTTAATALRDAAAHLRAVLDEPAPGMSAMVSP